MKDSKIKTITVEKILDDEYIQSKEGEYFDENYYKKPNRHILIGENVDVYKKNGELLLKIRRGVIPKKFTDLALEAFLDASKVKHENRGAAAGVLDRNKMPNYIGEFVNQGKFRTGFISKSSNILSKQVTSNLSQSNIVGFFDVHDRNLKGNGVPCRLTAFNKKNPELWKKSLPFIKYCDNLFKELVPKRHKVQKDRASLTPDFTIPDTAYSTITINYSWRTGLHRDTGDLKEGYGNLIVIEDPNNPNKYDGCYLGFPQYGVCVDVRTGDYLAMDVHEWHCNTEFKPRKRILDSIKKFKKKDIENDWIFNRLSMVMYLREKMIKCTDKSLFINKIGGYSNKDEYINNYSELLNNDSELLSNNYISKHNKEYQKYKNYIFNKNNNYNDYVNFSNDNTNYFTDDSDINDTDFSGSPSNETDYSEIDSSETDFSEVDYSETDFSETDFSEIDSSETDVSEITGGNRIIKKSKEEFEDDLNLMIERFLNLY